MYISDFTDQEDSDQARRTTEAPLPKEAELFTARFKGLLAPVFTCFRDDE